MSIFDVPQFVMRTGAGTSTGRCIIRCLSCFGCISSMMVGLPERKNRDVKMNDHTHAPNATPVMVGMVADTYRVGDHIRSGDWLRAGSCTSIVWDRSRSRYMPARKALYLVKVTVDEK